MKEKIRHHLLHHVNTGFQFRLTLTETLAGAATLAVVLAVYLTVYLKRKRDN
jgi:hypothetical protein